MNPKEVLEILLELRMLRFFPQDEGVMDALVRLCGSMCSNIGQMRWLVDRMTSGIYAEWPGPAEMRACFCYRYKPKDGISIYSTVYPEGLPPDPTAPPRTGIVSTEQKALPAGHTETADPEFEAEIHEAAAKLKMPAAHPAVSRFGEMLRNIETPPDRRQGQEKPVNLDFKPITQEDIERAVQELHVKQQ